MATRHATHRATGPAKTPPDLQCSPVPRAVHGFKGESVLVHVEGKRALAVVLPVARDLPQLAAVHVWGHHFCKVVPAVLLLQDERV